MKLRLLTKKGQKRLQNVHGLDFFQNGWIFNTHMLLHSPHSCIKNPSKAKRQYGIFHYIQHRCIKNKSKKIPSIIQTSLTNMQIEFLINGFKNYFLIYSWRKLPTWQFCVINFLDSTWPQGTIFNRSGVYFHACIKYLVRTVYALFHKKCSFNGSRPRKLNKRGQNRGRGNLSKK